MWQDVWPWHVDRPLLCGQGLLIEIIKVVKEWVVGVAMLDWPGQVVDQTFGKLAGLTVIEQVVNLPKIKYVIQVMSKVSIFKKH